MSSLPPPLPNPSMPNPSMPEANGGEATRRWHRIDRWKRWTAYGAAIVVGVGAIGAVTGSSDDATLRTVDNATATTAQGATVESTIPTPTTAPHTAPTTADTRTAIPQTTGAAPVTIAPTTIPPATTTPATSTPATTIPGTLAALDVLATIPTAREQPDGYNRELFGYGSPVDGFGCRTRALVLIRDSLTPAQIDRVGCAVVAGDWFSNYDAVTASDVGEVQIDHVVSLKEAWDSGANSWDAARLEAFANDVAEPRTLRVVTGSVNQAKSDNDPVNWLPPDASAVCQYLADWVSIKARWGLSMDESEHGRVRNLLTDDCPGQTIAPWVAVPPAVPTAPVVAPPVVSPPVATPPVISPPTGPSDPGCDSSYPDVCIPPAPPDLDCGDISIRRFRVLPPDPHRFDGNHDGVGCES